MQPSKMTNDELAAAVSKGAAVALFISENAIYRDIILPAIAEADKVASRDGDWRPGHVTDAVAIAIYNSYNSGKKDAHGFVASVLERVVRDGEEARKELERRGNNAGKK